MSAAVAAIVFDFDGTILDTETPVYESWAAAYRYAGAEPIPLTTWLDHIGKALHAFLDSDFGVRAAHVGLYPPGWSESTVTPRSFASCSAMPLASMFCAVLLVR